MKSYLESPIHISLLLKKAIIAALFSFLFASTHAQTAEMWLDTNVISIGNPVHLTIDLKFTSDTKIDSLFWPVFGDTLTSHIEKLNESRVDTLRKNPSNPDEFQLRQVLTLTSWDSGYWAIPPVSFLVRKDTLFTNPVLLQVNVPQVNMNEDIKDVSDIYDIGTSWKEWLRKYWYLLLAALVLAAAVVYYRKKLMKKPAETSVPAAPIISISPAELASQKLEALRTKQLWQQGMTKEYYVELTEILREYMENNFGISCLEATTSETMMYMRQHNLLSEFSVKVGRILELGDMAKFAKQKPMSLQNEQVFIDALDFVTVSSRLTRHQA